MELISVRLVNNKPTYNGKEVQLPILLHTLLLGKGENKSILVYKKDVSYEANKS